MLNGLFSGKKMTDNTTLIVRKDVEGVVLSMPKILANIWPRLSIHDFPDFCGAGEGFGEKIVPETFYGMSVRHNCFIHDITHTILPPTVEYWHISNELMLVNCLRTIRAFSTSKVLRYLRERRAVLYFDGVESKTGLKCYLNREDGNYGQKGYNPFNDPTFIAKLKKVGVTL